MKYHSLFVILCFGLLGCGKYATEFSLDEVSFNAETMELIEKESGLDLPDGAKGLGFHYIPPIDPIYYAMILVPPESLQSMEEMIKALSEDNQFPEYDITNDRCEWWSAAMKKRKHLVKKSSFERKCVEAYLIQEEIGLVLYLKCFSEG